MHLRSCLCSMYVNELEKLKVTRDSPAQMSLIKVTQGCSPVQMSLIKVT